MMPISTASTWKPTDHLLLIPIIHQSTDWAEIPPLKNVQSERLTKHFTGKKNEVQWLFTEKQTIVLFGIGEADSSATAIIRSFRHFANRYAEKLTSKLAVYTHHLEDQTVEYAVNGLLLGTYQIGQFKTEEAPVHAFEQKDAELLIYSDQEVMAFAEKGKATAETQMSILNIVNAPANKKTPQILAEWAKNSAQQFGYESDIWDKQKIKEVGLHALLAVNRGSEDPAQFIILEYKGKNAKQKVGLVGKGVTFDTGGISIKGSANMHYMKSDMGGAAAVLGTIELAAKLQLPIHVVCIVPATDNSVDALSIKPSDVIESYSGKTIEIIDTDAEGRLILSDGIAYMVKHFQPDVLIDLATLTGSAVRTFGYHAGALFSNNDNLAAAIEKAGDATGERVWRLPLWKAYEEDLKSDVADVKNFSGRPIAGAIGAAKFLEYFTDEHPNWAHLDMAGVAFNEAEFSHQKSATAFGVRLLVEYLEELAQVNS